MELPFELVVFGAELEQVESYRVPWAPTSMLQNFFWIPRLAERHAIDAVVYQAFSPRSSSHSVLNLVYDVIDLDHPEFFTPSERGYLWLRNRSLRNADRLITISHSERARLVRLQLAKPENIEVMPLAADSRFVPVRMQDAEALASVRVRYALPRRYAVYIGRLNVRKSVASMLEASRQVEELNESCQLLIIGSADREFERASGALLHERIKSGAVRHIQGMSDADVASVLSMAEAMVYPSLDEGFGLPVLEALAAEVPVVLSDIPAHREVCERAGLYFPPGDQEALACQLSGILRSPTTRSNVLAEGRAIAARYSWQRSAEALVDSICETLRERGWGHAA